MKKKTALLGLHNPDNLEKFVRRFRRMGYKVTQASMKQEFIPLAEKKKYDAYFWDANLGDSGGMDISTSEELWKIIKLRYQKGKIKCMSVSYRPDVIELVKSKGIPCEDKLEFMVRNYF